MYPFCDEFTIVQLTIHKNSQIVTCECSHKRPAEYMLGGYIDSCPHIEYFLSHNELIYDDV